MITKTKKWTKEWNTCRKKAAHTILSKHHAVAKLWTNKIKMLRVFSTENITITQQSKRREKWKHEAHIVRWLESCHDYFLLIWVLSFHLSLSSSIQSIWLYASLSYFLSFCWVCRTQFHSWKSLGSNIQRHIFSHAMWNLLVVCYFKNNWRKKTIALKLHSIHHKQKNCWIVNLLSLYYQQHENSIGIWPPFFQYCNITCFFHLLFFFCHLRLFFFHLQEFCSFRSAFFCKLAFVLFRCSLFY